MNGEYIIHDFVEKEKKKWKKKRHSVAGFHDSLKRRQVTRFDFLFALQHAKPFLKRDLFQKEVLQLLLRTHFHKGQNNFDSLLLLKVYLFSLK